MNRMNWFALAFIAFCAFAFIYGGIERESANMMESRLWQMGFLAARLIVAFFIGYHGSRFILKDFRPKDLKTPEGCRYMLYRSIIVSGCCVGAGMAV